jgi:hypothetical protein
MRIAELQELAERLEEPAHLVVWNSRHHFEVVAVAGVAFRDAFPLPLPVQAAAAEAGLILDTSTAARIEIERMPDDFWTDLRVVDYGPTLRISMLGRAGAKYLEVFHAVRAGAENEVVLPDLTLDPGELLQVTRWLREEGIFDHRNGDLLMEVLTRLGQ